MKKAVIILPFLLLLAGSLHAQTVDSFSVIRSSLPYRLYVRIALPADNYTFSRYVERNLNNAQNTQLFSFLFKDCPGVTVPLYYDTVVNIGVTQYTPLFEVKVYAGLDENNIPPCTIRGQATPTDSLYLTGSEIMSIPGTRRELFLSVYPNPAGNTLHIETDAEVISCHITDVAGRRLLSSNDITRPLSLRLPDGVYLLHLLTPDTRITRSFVVRN